MMNTYDFLSAQGDDYKKLSSGELLFVHYQCPQRDRYMKSYTHMNAIVYVISGVKRYHSAGQSLALHEGQCFFVRKGASRQERWHDKDWIVISFFMPDQYLKKLFKEYRSSLVEKALPEYSSDMVLSLHMQGVVKGLFDSMIPYFLQKPQPSEKLIEIKYRELLIGLLSDQKNALLLSYLNHISYFGQTPIDEIMEANFTFNLSMAEYARLAQRSLATFRRDFVIRFKTTPGKWLTEKRLRHAQWLLDTTGMNVNEVAAESGFESVTHFSKVFKEKFGRSPMHYRRLPAGSPAETVI